MATKNVYEVTSVKLTIQKSKPPIVQVTAEGTVRTGGWTNPRLEAVIYVAPPADGIQDLNFVADEPYGASTDAITPITSKELDLGRVAEWMKGVRVIAETNQKEELF